MYKGLNHFSTMKIENVPLTRVDLTVMYILQVPT